MIYKRLIGCIVVRGGLAVQSFGFHKYLPIGKPEIVAKFLNDWEVDEIVLLDIDATPAARAPDYRLVERVARSIYTPMSVGGGVREPEHIHELLRSGADKVVINSAILDNPGLLTAAAHQFGQQCLIASVDARKTGAGYEVRQSGTGGREMPMSVLELAKQAEQHGAGEILLNSVDHDGLRCGYDIDLLTQVGEHVSIPLIAVGGAGHPDHIAEALKLPCVSAVGVGNMLNHCEHSVLAIKSCLSNAGINIRHGAHVDRMKGPFDEDGRLSKKSDDYLDEADFVAIESDAI